MFRGIFAPIPTPFDGSGEIYWDKLKENLHWWGKTALAGVVVCGSNGEAALLDGMEKERLFAFVRANLPSAKKVIAGTGCESTRETVSLSRRAAGHGADAVLVINPSFYKGELTEEALRAHYIQVADSSTVPVIVYNMPRNTGLNMPSALICGLSEHPHIAGIKDSSGNIVQISEIVSHARATFFVFAGSANFLLPALSVGAVGGTLALANVLPDQCVQVYELFHKGKIEEARELQLKLLDLNAAVTSRWGVAGLKAALELIGLYGGPVRPPLLPPGQGIREKLKQMLLLAAGEEM